MIKLFRLETTTIAILLTFMATTFVISTTTSAVLCIAEPTFVSKCSLWMQDSLITTITLPSSSIAIPITNYSENNNLDATVSIIANNPEKACLSWLYYSGLENSIITGNSANGLIGHQQHDQWKHAGVDEKLMITVDGSLNFAEIKNKPGKTLTIALLSYGESVANIPLLSISVYVEEPEKPTPSLLLRANATISKLELEIAEVEKDNLFDTTIYGSSLFEAQLYYSKGSYAEALESAQSALEQLRQEKADYYSVVLKAIRWLTSYWYLIAIPVVGLVGYKVLRRKNSEVEED